jgi:hypothetical protein
MMGTEYAHTRTSMGLFNCAFYSTKNIVTELSAPFRFLMDVSMLGVGCGFDTKGAGQLELSTPGPDSLIFSIPDSREGWVDSVGKLIDSYLISDSSIIDFDYSGVREKDSPIRGFGGTSSGPDPLKKLHETIRYLFDKKIESGDRSLDSRLIVDVMNLIGECVVSGNVRRCLPEGTEVHTDEGLVLIEDIKVGSMVLTSKGYRKVSELIIQGVQEVMLIETSLGSFECTGSHRVAVFETDNHHYWKKADQLRTTDKMVTLSDLSGNQSDRVPVEILNITHNHRKAFTFDISVGDVHEFVAGCGLLVHNSAEMAIGDPTDLAFLNLKNYEINPDRKNFGRYSNNTVDVRLGQSYSRLADRTVTNGEPGYIWLENCRKFGRMIDPPNWKDANVSGTNPCGEISLESGETCNLVEIFMPNIANKREFFNVIKYAYLYAKSVTLVQTHLEENNRVQMRNRRIGLSLSGIALFKEKEGVTKTIDWMDDGYQKVHQYDEIYSKWLAIPKSIKTTTVKPSGSISLVAGVTSGIHYPCGAFFYKNVRIGNSSDIMEWATRCGYKIEPEIKYEEDAEGNWNPSTSDNTSVVTIPVKFPVNIRSREEVSIWEQMKLVELVQKYWADNQVSVSVTFNEGEDSEVSRVLEMFDRDLKTVSFVKNSCAEYPQMPEESVSEEEFEKYVASLAVEPLLAYVKEDAEGVNGCSTDSCELQLPEFKEYESE